MAITHKQFVSLVNRSAEYYYDLGQDLLARLELEPAAGKPTVKFSTRPSKIAGRAKTLSWAISLNVPLLTLYPSEIDSTVGHEIAHLFADTIHGGGVKHGRLWELVMEFFSLRPDRLHYMDPKDIGKNITIYVYCCTCTYFKFGPKRHNRMSRGAVFTCRACNGPLQFVQAYKRKQLIEANVHTPEQLATFVNDPKNNDYQYDTNLDLVDFYSGR